MQPPVAHRDIKSHNVLLAGTAEKEVAKLADFGSCFAGYTMAGRVVDNPVWLAPEVMFGKDYGVEVDIYSFGIVMYEIASSMDPFEEFHFRFISMLEEQILTGLRPTLPDHCPAVYAQLAARCWQTNPSSRPTAQECIDVLEQLKMELLKQDATK
jgi:serine/threonine protein kinase